MRWIVFALLAAVALTPAASPLAQNEAQPTRKPGWWEMQYVVVGASAFGTGTAAKPIHHTIHICTDAAVDKVKSPFDVNMTASGCRTKTVRTASGWASSGACGNDEITGNAVATGDLNDRYHVDIVTHTISAPSPETAEVKIGIDARWVGRCPAGKNPGDIEDVP
jgi:hypothetical protein